MALLFNCLYEDQLICSFDITDSNYILNYELKKKWKIAQYNGELKCMECGEEVVLKANDPRKMTPHFAHIMKSSNCTQTGEYFKESAEHKKGKYLLYHFYSKQENVRKVSINHIFKSGRRSDLLVELDNGKQLAVEFQRFGLKGNDWFKREEHYSGSDIKSVWFICGTEHVLEDKLREVEMTFLEQIQLNEKERVANFLDVDKQTIILMKKMLYIDPFINEPAAEELFKRNYLLDSLKINNEGELETDFLDLYNAQQFLFDERNYQACLQKEKERQAQKKEQDRMKKMLKEDLSKQSTSRINKYSSDKPRQNSQYFVDRKTLKDKIKGALQGNISYLELLKQDVINAGMEDYQVITYIFKKYYEDKRENTKELYDDLMKNYGIGNTLEESINHSEDFTCPRCSSKLLNKYGRYGSYMQCVNIPVCKFSFNY